MKEKNALHDANLITDELGAIMRTNDVAGLQGLALAYGSDGTLEYVWPVHPGNSWEPSKLPPLDFPPEVEDPASSSLLDTERFERIANIAIRSVNVGDEPTPEDFLELGKRTNSLWGKVAELLNRRAVEEGRGLLIVAYPVDGSVQEMAHGVKIALQARRVAEEASKKG